MADWRTKLQLKCQKHCRKNRPAICSVWVKDYFIPKFSGDNSFLGSHMLPITSLFDFGWEVESCQARLRAHHRPILLRTSPKLRAYMNSLLFRPTRARHAESYFKAGPNKFLLSKLIPEDLCDRRAPSLADSFNSLSVLSLPQVPLANSDEYKFKFSGD